jgi:recombination protein RecA
MAAAMNKINKDMGAGTMMRASQMPKGPKPRITSGSLGLDVILGGGWPTNHWIELWGKQSSGKTTIVYKTLAANQKLDPNWECLWIMAEDFDDEYAVLLGVDVDRVWLFDNNVMEDVYKAIIDATASGDFDMIVLDSLPALVPMREDAASDVTDVEPGLGARRTNSLFRRMGKAADRKGVMLGSRRPTTVFIINQPRVMIGGYSRHGTPMTTPGGEQKNYACSVQVELARVEFLKDGTVPVGQTIKATVRKNKTHAPYKTCEFDFYFDSYEEHDVGTIDILKEIVSIGTAMGIFGKKGAWLTYEGEQWNGQAKLTDALRADPVLAAKVADEVLMAIRTVPERYTVKDANVEED